jgi:transposase
MLEALAEDLRTRGELDLRECFIDGTFVVAKKGGTWSGKDQDPLDEQLAQEGIQVIAPHRDNRTKAPTQDGRSLRRYRRRWKIERLFAWLQNYRRLIVRHDYKIENFVGFVHLGCILFLLKSYL